MWLGTQIQCIPRREQITRMDLWLLQKLEESQGLGENRCFFQISLVCTLWTIWNERNQAFHHGRDPNPWASLHMANLIIMTTMVIGINKIREPGLRLSPDNLAGTGD